MDGMQFSFYSSRGLTPFKIKLFYSGKDGLVVQRHLLGIVVLKPRG